MLLSSLVVWGLGQMKWAKKTKTSLLMTTIAKIQSPEPKNLFFIAGSRTCQVFWAFEPEKTRDHGAGVPKWTTARVCILGWSRSRSQYFRFEQEPELESTLTSVQESIKLFRDLISVMMLVVVKQNGINWDVFSGQCRHISQKCDTWWEYWAFHH